MKNCLRSLLLVAALLAATSAFAQGRGPGPRGSHDGPPPGELNSDGSITLPDGTVLPPMPGPGFNSDGTITLPDGTVIDPSEGLPPPHQPPMINADGSITLRDGTVIAPNADGTFTMPDGRTIDPSKAPTPPADRPAPGAGRGHRGPPPGGG